MRISEDEEDEMETSSSDNATVILTNNETVNATKQLNDDNVMNLYGDDGMVLEGGVSAYDELPLYNDDVLIDRDGNNLDDNNMYLDDNIVTDVDGYFNGEVDVGRRMDEMDSGCFNDNNDDEPVIEHRNYLLSTLSAATKRPIIRRIRIIKPSKNVIYSK
ncbi:unnamed protein product [Anisakis simplex]|uniref:Uncharacterized protein n=1 Tax=Anisakis simplex TaxID=6269 RepID=A0A0M3J4S8_ANISI|nr:unnamed protein product [Anisakis simplex]